MPLDKLSHLGIIYFSISIDPIARVSYGVSRGIGCQRWHMSQLVSLSIPAHNAAASRHGMLPLHRLGTLLSHCLSLL